MTRPWKPREFDSLYEQLVCQQEVTPAGRSYCHRYRSRYKECVRRFAELAPPRSVDVLDIGGGQLALMAAKLWSDRGAVADLPGAHLPYLAELGVETIDWNLCNSEPPFTGRFDFVFFSEVIEHMPIPGHIVLERLRKVLRPGGAIICTTPNLHRLRNLVCMTSGAQIFDHFQYAENDIALGHILEYSREHLDWQFRKAGFTRCKVEYSQMHHSTTNPMLRPLAWVGYPLHLIPHWRDNLVAIAYAPQDTQSAVH